MAINIRGIKERSGEAATILEGTPIFKFIVEFKGRKVGYYAVQWRVKLLENFSLPNGLRFSVVVSYDAEPDTSGSFDVPLRSEELEKLGNEHPHGLDLDLKLEELVVIQPHEGEVTVGLSLSNIESERRFEYSGLQVDFAEFKPFTGDNHEQSVETGHTEGQRTEPTNVLYVKRAAELKFP
ncbi:hypothetical protein BGZ65_008803, partial [Modicella reniformis]